MSSFNRSSSRCSDTFYLCSMISLFTFTFLKVLLMMFTTRFLLLENCLANSMSLFFAFLLSLHLSMNFFGAPYPPN